MTTTTRASDTYKHYNNNDIIIYDSNIGRGREREADSTDRAESLVVGACISVRLLSQKVEPLMRSVFYKPSFSAFIYINYNIINNYLAKRDYYRHPAALLQNDGLLQDATTPLFLLLYYYITENTTNITLKFSEMILENRTVIINTYIMHIIYYRKHIKYFEN